MDFLRQIRKKIIRAEGNEAPEPRERVRHPLSPLIALDIDLLLDVGANTGQYAQHMRRKGFAGTIVSFEPLPDAHESLCSNAESDPKWLVHDRCAIGATQTSVEINIAGNSQSSSILPMLDTHREAAPGSEYVGRCQTAVLPLDSILSNYRKSGERIFLKIDTQGYESEVLRGAENALKVILAVEVELSTIALYQDQPTYQHFFDYFRERGFGLWSLVPGFFNKQTGRMLQFDAVFVRTDALASIPSEAHSSS